ncbi:MAG TPA: nucleotidyltransferase family protein [Candidatus Angelobacter sp.]|nr:nucleotidyltransferase family protein [Candidatus Angelobacter sp.]
MKAFILAAGHGTRLRPLTDTLPKCLLPIRQVPLLQIWLQNCERAGVDEVIINAHSHIARLRKFVQDQNGKIKIHLFEERVLLGSAGTLAEYSNFVLNEKTFLILYADVLTNVMLADFLAFHRAQGKLASIGIHRVPDPSRCGVVGVDSREIVTSFTEKPAIPESNWVFSGIMATGNAILDLLPSTRPADLGFHLLPQLTGEMAAFRISDYLMDIGTQQSYAAAQTSWRGL